VAGRQLGACTREYLLRAHHHGYGVPVDKPSIHRNTETGSLSIQASVFNGFTDGQCIGGALVVTQMGDLERNAASRLLLRMMGPGNFHPVEYQLHYGNLREDVARRTAAFVEDSP
jgi:hypothetical protein